MYVFQFIPEILMCFTNYSPHTQNIVGDQVGSKHLLTNRGLDTTMIGTMSRIFSGAKHRQFPLTLFEAVGAWDL